MFSLSDFESDILIALAVAQKKKTEESVIQELVGKAFVSWNYRILFS